MKKLVALVLALAMMLMATAALADIRVSNLKVEIDAALKEYAAEYSKTAGFNVEAYSVGGGADYSGSVKAELQAGNMPDIFVIEGLGGYNVWKDYIEDLSDTEFAKNTSVGFTVDGKTYGFPVAVEGFGLAYNKDLLAKAEIDPATLTTTSALKAAFEKLDGMKEELGIDAVVSMATSVAGGMTWVTGNQNFSAYLSCGLPYGDMTVIDQMREGKVDEARLTAYATFVDLLFTYSDQNILLNGNYDDNVNAFATGKTVFCHQGNWIDPSLAAMKESGMEIPAMGFIGEVMFDDQEITGLMVSAPSWYVVNSQSPNKAEAIKFLEDMVATEAGQDYMVNKAGMVPAFSNVTLEPSGDLSKDVMKAAGAGDIYSWGFGYMPDGFGQNNLGPIFELLAQKAISVDEFVAMVADQFTQIPALLESAQ
ncbi:MAG: ABC transporter substrate-binding protein [Clostridia bacterium]|nr:ABC transporter substrate-binding protein [Clostridia bacterium]